MSTRRIGDRGWLLRAIDVLRHRGPDGSGHWWSDDGRVGFAHRRLAIIDLSPGGHQPMVDRSGRLRVVFNGEIYNYLDLKKELRQLGHEFASDSDTEVLLTAYRQWGENCLDHLNGMFAFALHDTDRNMVLMARDRAGEKPLYYFPQSGSLSFASEMKALMLDPSLERRIDPESLDCFLGMGFVPGDRSMLRMVRKLPPGHALSFDLHSGVLRTWRYWSLPEPGSHRAKHPTDQELVEELERLLQAAVERQLVADVPVGVLLSGGVDSSIVTALATRARSKVKTFTVRFPGSARHDESQHARRIADHFGTDHQTLEAEDSTVELLPMLARQFDEPLNDSSMVPTYLVSRLVREHCTVALGGDGADELFGGYTHYDRLLRLEKLTRSCPRFLRGITATAAGSILPIGFKGRNWVQAFGSDFDRQVPLVARYFDREARLMFLSSPSAGAAERHWAEAAPGHGDLLDRATRMDFSNYLPEDILVKVDRASMLNSLEVRAPMLDQRVVEFAFEKVPSRLKATPSGRKIILRRLATRLLPQSFDSARKQGFSIPISSWLESGPWLSFFKEVLLDTRQSTFDRRFIENLFRGQATGRSNGERLFGLVMFELWRREYGVHV